jgi:hypothetical protein
VTVEDGDASYEAALAGKPYIARKSLIYVPMLICTDSLQLCQRGSAPILGQKSPTPKTGCFLLICCGSAVGTKF